MSAHYDEAEWGVDGFLGRVPGTDGRPEAGLAALLAEHLNNGCTDWRCEIELHPIEGEVHVDEPMADHLAEIAADHLFGSEATA